jgi:hypothetical protein
MKKRPFGFITIMVTIPLWRLHPEAPLLPERRRLGRPHIPLRHEP